jgi:predicted O-methyltransferase YrrM
MISGHAQGKFLEFICRMVKPERILEIGTFTGFSTICMAKAIGENSVIDTIEVNDELQDTISDSFKKQVSTTKLIYILETLVKSSQHYNSIMI